MEEIISISFLKPSGDKPLAIQLAHNYLVVSAARVLLSKSMT